MDLTLRRMEFREDGIFSELLKPNNEVFLHTLEHAYPNPDKTVFVPKIYNGIFKCVRGVHKLERGPRFETFEVTGVAGHTGILFHKGNFNTDSDGCILLGMTTIRSTQGMTMLCDSNIAFNNFMKLQEGVAEFNLTVVDFALPHQILS